MYKIRAEKLTIAYDNEDDIEYMKLLENENCKDCTDCILCKDCKNCIKCDDCDRCTNCTNCLSCVDCVRCIDCVRSVNCVDCFNAYNKHDEILKKFRFWHFLIKHLFWGKADFFAYHKYQKLLQFVETLELEKQRL